MAAEGAERRVLQRLAQTGPLTAAALRIGPDLLSELTGHELVVARPGKRGSTMVEITLAGRQRADEWAALPATAPPVKRTARAQPKVSEDRLARIEALLEQILARLPDPTIPAAPVQPDRPIREVKSLLLDTIAELDQAHRYGGLVPIPEIRRAVRAHNLRDAQVTEALESLEQDYAIDLNIAQQPTTVSPGDRLAGIERPGRGLLFYVARRAP